MYNIIFLLIFGFHNLLTCFSDCISTTLNYSPNSLVPIKQKAQSEHKLILLEFYTTWCEPCTWMSQNAFDQEGVQKILKDNYLHVKINIDTENGFELKNLYSIRYLPTIIILNSHAKILEIHENPLSVTKLTKVLTKNNTVENKHLTVHAVNQSPKQKVDENTNPKQILWLDPIVIKQLDEYSVLVATCNTYKEAISVIENLNRETNYTPLIQIGYQSNTPKFSIFLSGFKKEEEIQKFFSIRGG